MSRVDADSVVHARASAAWHSRCVPEPTDLRSALDATLLDNLDKTKRADFFSRWKQAMRR